MNSARGLRPFEPVPACTRPQPLAPGQAVPLDVALVAAIQSDFTALLVSFAATAIGRHELPAHEDPGRLAFELHAILLAADTKFVMHDDPAVLDLARQIVRQRLGLDNTSAAGDS